MVTALQVTASTQQAVGAFNQLAQAVANATTQFQSLQNQLAAGQVVTTRYGTGIERVILGAFEKLQRAVSMVVDSLKILAGVMGVVFSSILRELDKLQGFGAIMSVTTKSANDASAAYNFLRQTADRLGVQFDALTSNYAKLVAAIPEGTNRLDIANRAFMGVAMAARTLHSSNQETQLMFYAITQMASKGVVSMEELRRQLGEKLPGVMNIAARALSTTPELLEAAIRKSTVNSVKFLDAFADELIRTFSDSSQMASQTVSAALNRLTNVWVDFVKAILDSGAGQSIVNLFDALREKLSDPYVIERFAQLIKMVADRFTEFISNLTRDDVRNGFDTMANGVSMVITVLGKFVELMTWVINNADRAGSIIGAIGGAAAGAVGGAVVGSAFPGVGTAIGAIGGAAIGAAGGSAGGYAAGRSIMPTSDQRNQRVLQDQLAVAKATHETAKQQFILDQQVMPMLQSLKGLNSLRDVQQLLKPDRLNEGMVRQLEKIFTDKRFKTDSDRVTAVKWLAKSGEVLGPPISLASTIGPGTPKKGRVDNEQKRLDDTWARAVGLNGNYQEEMQRLNVLFGQGKLSMEQFHDAQTKLLNQQPFMAEALKKERKEIEANNKAFEDFMQLIVLQIGAREKLKDKLDDDQRIAGMRSEDIRIESQVVAEVNKFKQVGLDMTSKEIAQLREKFQIIENIRAVTAAEEQVLRATVDKWKPQTDMLKGIEKAMADPASGLTKQGATDYLVTQDPNAAGSAQQMDAQRRATEEYYSWIDGLRKKDLISEQTAQMMKAKAMIEADATRVSQAKDFFSNLAALSNSGNKKIAAVGRAAAVAQATIDGYVAVQKALASAPPPLNYALAAAVGVAAAANVAKIMGIGFDQGGYTGSGSRSAVAGVVHGQEFVVNAAATARNRATLEAMNDGRSVSTSAGTGGGQALDVKVIVNNNAPDTQSRVSERDTPNGREIEVTIERVVVGSIRRGGKIADAVEGQYGLNRSVGTAR